MKLTEQLQILSDIAKRVEAERDIFSVSIEANVQSGASFSINPGASESDPFPQTITYELRRR